MKLFFKSFFISIFCFGLLFGIGYLYITKNVIETKNEAPKIPYSQELQENVGVLFKIEDEETFVNFDFYNEKIIILLNPEESINNEICGYTHNFTIKGTREILTKIIDYLNGLEFTVDNEYFRYTGIQTIDLIHTNKINDYEREIIKKICEKIVKQGIANDFFADILNNSITDMRIGDCYFWADEMQKICSNVYFVD